MSSSPALVKRTTYRTVLGVEGKLAMPYAPARPATPYIPEVLGRAAVPAVAAQDAVFARPAHYGYVFVPEWTRKGQGEITQDFILVQTLRWLPASRGTPAVKAVAAKPAFPGTPAVPAKEAIPMQPAVEAIPYEPAYTAANYNLGWNAGGRSLAFFTNNGYVQFSAPPGVVGVIAGLNIYDGIDARYSGTTTDYAFLLGHGTARIIENGVIGANVGSYTSLTRFRIARTGTVISYLKDDVEVFSRTGVPTGAGWLEVALYAGDDRVYFASVVQVSPPDLTAQTGQIDATLPWMVLRASVGVHAELEGELPRIELDAYAGLALPAYALMTATLPPAEMTARSLTGELGTIDAALRPLQMLAADHPYGEMLAELSPLVADFSAFLSDDLALMGSYAVMDSTVEMDVFLVITMRSSATASAVADAAVLHLAEMRASASLAAMLDSNAMLNAVMRSIARATFDTSGAGNIDTSVQTWVVNLDSMSTTSYSGYAFNSYARIGDRFYGACDTGVYELAGDTDAGAPIRAVIGLGERNFGTPNKKTVNECYVGMSGAGNLFIKVIAEGEEYIYRTRGYSQEMQQQRVTFGKGLRASYVTLEIYNEGGADFELDTVEFVLADLSRRI